MAPAKVSLATTPRSSRPVPHRLSAASSSSGSTVALTTPTTSVADSNAELLLRVESCVELILGRKEFKNIKQKSPLGVQNGGTGAAFDKGEYARALLTHSTYSCRINLFLAGFLFYGNGRRAYP